MKKTTAKTSKAKVKRNTNLWAKVKAKPGLIAVSIIAIALVGVLFTRLSSASVFKDPNQDRLNIVKIARAQLGVTEATPRRDDPTVCSFSLQYLCYTQGKSEDWCADFVSWVYHNDSSDFNA